MRIAPFPFVLPEDLRRFRKDVYSEMPSLMENYSFMDGLWLPAGTEGTGLFSIGSRDYEISFRHVVEWGIDNDAKRCGYPDYWNKVIANAERNIARATLTENERLAANVLLGLSREGRLESFYTDMRG